MPRPTLWRQARPAGLTAILLAFLATGCVESVHPVHDQKTVVFKPELIGSWEKGGSRWTFSKRDDQSYSLMIHDNKGNDLPFIAHLADLQGTLFLDLYPDKLGERQETFYDFHLIPVHSIFRVHEVGDQLHLGMMNLKDLQSQLESEPEAVEHVMVENRVLLTAPTKSLQEFLHRRRDAFRGDTKLDRKS